MTRPATTFDLVLGELADERARAVARHGYTDQHDDRHSDEAFAWLILRRASELIAPADVARPMHGDERRRLLLEVAHIAASAVAAHDRRQRLHEPHGGLPEPLTAHGKGMLVTSTDASSRYVLRPGEDTTERHTLGCVAWNERGTCRGECTTEATDEGTPTP